LIGKKQSKRQKEKERMPARDLPLNLKSGHREMGFLRVATVVPRVFIGDTTKNCQAAVSYAHQAADRQVDVLCFPELNLTGYSLGDGFLNTGLLSDARKALQHYLTLTAELDLVSFVGLPVYFRDKLFNVAAVCHRGRVAGVIAKTFLPNYGEFYEYRWFNSAGLLDDNAEIAMPTAWGDVTVPIGNNLIFPLVASGGACLGVLAGEICEDGWANLRPSLFFADNGATVIFNLSASNELVGKDDYRRDVLVKAISGNSVCAYAYCSAGQGESTAETVFGGHCLIAENGSILAERQPFNSGNSKPLFGGQYRAEDDELLVADVDVNLLNNERLRNKSNSNTPSGWKHQARTVLIELADISGDKNWQRKINPYPFVPGDPDTLDKRCERILTIMSIGLFERLRRVFPDPEKLKVAIAVSGGRDSALAFLNLALACRYGGWDMKKITAVTMPGPGTTFGSDGTYKDSVDLINALGATFREVRIEEQVAAHLRAIGHEPCWNCLQCENAQARERTQTVMDSGFTIGTGNLSEIIFGYCTYNGDQMSMYNPNCSIPKTLVNKLLKWIADKQLFGPEVSAIIYRTLSKKASPELVKSDGKRISQVTEEIIGQYPALDFDIYHFIRAGNSPRRLFQLACEAFKGVYEPEELLQWLETFLRRLLGNQFKRDASPNGPKVGTLSASPRADLRLPSDMAFPDSWRAFLDFMAEALAEERAQHNS